MGGVAKTVKKAVNNPIINPVGYVAHKALSTATKPLLGREVTPFQGYQLGAAGGGAVLGGRALGLFGGGGAAVPGATAAGIPPGPTTAGIGGAMSPTSTAGINTLRNASAQVGQAFKLGDVASLGGLGLLGAGLFGDKGPSIDEAIAAGQGDEAQRIINELAAEQEAKRTAFLGETKSKLAQRRAENVAKLQGRLTEQSRLDLPKTLEDLQGRGLLNSETAVAQALADKQAQNALNVQEFEQSQSLADSAIEDQIAQDILEGRMGLEQQALSRRFGIEDAAQNARIASIIAARQAKQNRNQGLIETGGQFLGYGLLPRLMGTA